MIFMPADEGVYFGEGLYSSAKHSGIPNFALCSFELTRERNVASITGFYKDKSDSRKRSFQSTIRLSGPRITLQTIEYKDEPLGLLTGYLSTQHDGTLAVAQSKDGSVKIAQRWDSLKNPGSFRVHGVAAIGENEPFEYSIDFGPMNPTQAQSNVVDLERQN